MRKVEKLFRGLAINSFTALTICFFSCMEVYIGSYNDFYLPFRQTWWIILAFSLFVIVTVTLLEIILPDKVFSLLNILCFSLGISTYIQELFLNGHMQSSASGRTEFGQQTEIVNIVVWLICLVTLVTVSII